MASSDQERDVAVPCVDCGDPCVDAGPGLGWQCVRANCYEDHHGPIVTPETRAKDELTRLSSIEAAARAAVDELYPFDPCELDAKEIELLTTLRAALEAK